MAFQIRNSIPKEKKKVNTTQTNKSKTMPCTRPYSDETCSWFSMTTTTTVTQKRTEIKWEEKKKAESLHWNRQIPSTKYGLQNQSVCRGDREMDKRIISSLHIYYECSSVCFFFISNFFIWHILKHEVWIFLCFFFFSRFKVLLLDLLRVFFSLVRLCLRFTSNTLAFGIIWNQFCVFFLFVLEFLIF